MNSSICIIPARGGSKRIPKKNIKLFLGKPIIYYPIKSALESNIFDVVMVSTDDEEISELAKKYGADVPFIRSKENSTDYASTISVIEEVMDNYDYKFDTVCCLYPCTPLVTHKLLKEAYLKLIETDVVNSVLPIVKYSYPIQRALSLKNSEVFFIKNKMDKVRTQDTENFYHDAGQFYFIKSNVIKNKENIIGNKTQAIILDELETQDIDNISDWKLAELKYKLLKETDE